MPDLDMSFKVDRFGGLNTHADPAELGLAGAVDLLNVDFDRVGRLRTRDGHVLFKDATVANYSTLSTLIPAGPQMITTRVKTSVPKGLNLRAYDSSGTQLATADITTTSTTPRVPSFARYGTPTTTRTYLTIWSTTTHEGLYYWDGSTFTASTGKPAFVSVTPFSERLVQGHYQAAADSPTGTDGSKSTVFFSDVGAPDSYTGNWVTLRPGDNEEIVAIVRWHYQLFVFKQSTVFVFYGESTDSTGGPIFNYRPMDLPSPLSTAVGTNSVPVVVGDDGIYFSTTTGIYRTNGEGSVCVSGDIEELFGVSTDYPLRFGGNAPSLAWANGRLFAFYTLAVGAAQRVLVYNPKTGMWALWSNMGGTSQQSVATFPPADASATFATGDFQDRMFFISGNSIYYTDPTATDDAGTAISWSYQSGWYDVSGQDFESATQYSTLRGTGTVSVDLLNDFSTTAISGTQAVTLGTAPTPAEGFSNGQGHGVLYSHKLSGTGAATVHSITHWVSRIRTTGLRSG